MSTNRAKDRASLCSFSFIDGRRCLSPRRDSHSQLCAFHARRKRKPTLARKPARTSPFFSLATMCPLATSASR